MGKKVLVIGSGGREHALCWKLADSPQVDKVFCAPGNGGISEVAECIDIDFTDVDNLLKFALEKDINLTVIGQEAASEAGAADAFQKAGLLIFGPTINAAKIETSKVFSKDLMKSENIPTAEYKTFTESSEAIEYAKSRSLPVVVKADGLATGKGVVVAETYEQAEDFINEVMVKKIFGDSGNKVVIEDFLKGQEVSTHAITDGKSAIMFPSSQDHKQVYDGDKGPNTGGMGVIAPVPWVNNQHMGFVEKNIVQAALSGLIKKGITFQGVLYPGLMIDGDNIKLLEFNARFGDPEAQVYLRLFDGDLYGTLLACAEGNLDPSKIKWHDNFCVCVCLVSGGYPGSYEKGVSITGIEDAEKLDDIVVFHAGTKKTPDGYATAGGRVLSVTATAGTLEKAIDKAYEAIKLIHFDNMHYRTDIGQRR